MDRIDGWSAPEKFALGGLIGSVLAAVAGGLPGW